MDLLWIMDSWLWLRSWVRVGFGNLYQRNTYQYTEQNVLAPWLTGEYNWFPPKGAILKERMPSIISRTDVKELMPSMKNKQRVGWLKERKLETGYPMEMITSCSGIDYLASITNVMGKASVERYIEAVLSLAGAAIMKHDVLWRCIADAPSDRVNRRTR